MIEENPFDFYTPEENQDASVETIPTEVSPVEEQPAPEQGTPVETPPEQAPQVEPTPEKIPGMTEPSEDRSLTIYNRLYPDDTDNKGFEEWKNGITSPRQFVKVYGDVVKSGLFEGSVDAFQKWIEGKDTSGIAPINKEEAFFRENLAEVPVSLEDQEKRKEQERILDINKRIEDRDSNLTKQRIEEQNSMVGAGYSDMELINRKYSGLRTSAINDALVYAPESLDYKGGGIEDITPEQLTKLKSGSTYEDMLDLSKRASKRTFVSTMFAMARGIVPAAIKQVIGQGGSFINRGKELYDVSKQTAEAMPEILEGNAKAAAYDDYLSLSAQRINFLWEKVKEKYPDAEEKLNTLQELSKDGWTPEDQKVAVEMGLQEWQMKFFNDDIVDKHKKAVDAYNNVQGEFKKLNEDFPARAAIMQLKRDNQAKYDAIYRSLPRYQQAVLNTVEKLSTFAEKGWELVTDSPVALGALFGLTETQLAVAGQMDDLMTVDPTPSNMQRDIYEQVGLYKEGDKEYQVIVDDDNNVIDVRDKEGYPVGFLTQESFEGFVSRFKASETPVNEQFNGGAFTSVLSTTGVDFAMTLALMQARGLSGIKGFNSALSSERMVSLLVPTFQYFAPMALQEVKGGATPQMASVKGFIGSLTEGLTEALNPMEARIARGMKLNKAAVTRMMRLDIPSWEKAIGVMADGSKQFVMELGEEVAANGMNSMVNDIAYENVGMLQFADDRGWKKFEKEFKPTFWLTLGLMGPVAIHHTRQSWFDAGSDGLYQQYVYNAVEDPARFMAISEEVRKQLGTGVINRTSGENKGFTPQEAAEKSIVIDREQQIVKELSDEYATVMQDGEIAETDKVRIVSNAHSLKQSEEVVDKLPEGVLKEKAQERLEKLKENHNTFLKEVLDNKGKPKNKKTYVPPADKEVEVLEDKPYFTKEEVGDKLEKVNTTTSSGGEEVNVLLDEYGNQYYEVPHNDGTVIIDAEKFQEWSKVDRQMSDALENATTEEEIDATREQAFENKRMVIGDVTAEEIAEINEANSFKEGNTVTFEDGQTAEVISVKKRGRGISEVVLQTDKGKVTLNNAKQVKAAVGKLRKYAPVNSKGINKQGLSDNVTENVSRINGITGSDEVSTSRKDNIVKHVDKKLDERNFDKTKEKAKRLQDNGVIASSGRIGDTAVVVGADGISYGNTAEGWKPIESVGVGNSIVYGNKSTPTLEILNRELSYNQDTDAILSNEVLASRHFASSQDLSETPHSTTAANNDAANKYIMSLPIIHEEDGHTLYQGDGVVYVVDANGKVLPSNEAIDVMDGFGQSFLPPEVEQVMEDAMSDSANSDQVLRDLAELLGDSFPGPWVFDSSHSDTSVLGKRLPKSLHKKIKNVIMAFTNVMPNIKIVVKTNATWNRQDTAYFNRGAGEIHINVDTINDKVFAHEVIHPVLLAIMHHNPELYASMENDIYDAFLKGDIPSLNSFMESYANKPTVTQRHEALTEFFAKVVEGHIVLEGKDVVGLNKAIKAVVRFINDVLGIDLGNVFNLDDISSSADIVHTVNLIRDVLDGNVIMTVNERINGKESTFDEFGDIVHRSNLTKEGKGVLDDIFAMFSNSPNRFGSFDTFRGRVAELMSTPNPVTPYRRNYTREEAIEEVIKNPSKPDIEKIISFGQFASEVRKSELDAELSSIIGDKGIRWMDPAIYKNINKWGEYRGSKSAVLQNAIYVDTGRIKVGETMRLEDMISSKGNSTIPTIFSVYPWLRNVNVTFKDIPYKGSIVGGMTSHTDIVDSILGDYVLSGGVIGNETEKFINLVDEAFRSRKGFDEFNKVFSVIPGFTENYLFDKMDEFAANTDMELSQTYITNPDLAEYSQADLVNTIFHEVQHLIQDYEEWPQGGNVGSILRSINDTPFSRVYNTSFSSVDAISDIVNLSDYSGILKTTVYDGNTYQTYVIEVPENNAGRIALVKEFRAARLSAMADNLKAHDTKKQELVKLAGFNTSNVKGLTLEDIATALYYNLEGEVQANAAGRLSESYPDNYVVSPYVAKISKSITKEELASSVDKIQNDFNSNVAKAVEPMLDVLGKYSTEYSPALADSPFAVYKDNLGKAYALPEESVVRNELYPAGFDAATANQARAWEDTEQVDTELSSYEIPPNRVTSLGLDPENIDHQWMSKLIDELGWLNNLKPRALPRDRARDGKTHLTKLETINNEIRSVLRELQAYTAYNFNAEEYEDDIDFAESAGWVVTDNAKNFADSYFKLTQRLSSSYLKNALDIFKNNLVHINNPNRDSIINKYELAIKGAELEEKYKDVKGTVFTNASEEIRAYNSFLNEIKNNQLEGLQNYIDYYVDNSDVNIFGLYVLTQIAKFDAIINDGIIKINKRSPSYTRPIESINAEALRNLYAKGPTNEPFIKAYVEEKQRLAEIKIEHDSANAYYKGKNGIWKKYTSSNNAEDVSDLGTGTGWCTANVQTAEHYLRYGDIAVFIKDGKSTIQLNYNDSEILEVGGLLNDQALSNEDTEDLTEFLIHENHPGKDRYILDSKKIKLLNGEDVEMSDEELEQTLYDTGTRNGTLHVYNIIKNNENFRGKIENYIGGKIVLDNMPEFGNLLYEPSVKALISSPSRIIKDIDYILEKFPNVEYVIGNVFLKTNLGRDDFYNNKIKMIHALNIQLRDKVTGAHAALEQSTLFPNLEKVRSLDIGIAPFIDNAKISKEEERYVIERSSGSVLHFPKLKELQQIFVENGTVYVPALVSVGDISLWEGSGFSSIIAPSLERADSVLIDNTGYGVRAYAYVPLIEDDVYFDKSEHIPFEIIQDVINVFDNNAIDTELSSIPQDDDTVNKILAKINEETNPAKKEVLIEAASIGLGIPADELRTRAREFSGTSKVRRQIAKAVNAMSPYSGTYPGVTINAITNSVVKKLREDGVTEEEFPDSSVKEMVSEAVLARHNTRPEVGKNEQRFLRKIAKEVTPDNNVMAVVAKHRKNYRNNYKAELPWQYVDDLSKGIDPFKKKAKSSKTAKRDGLSDNVRDMLTSIPVEERSVSEQARLRDVIWDQFLANSEGNELEAAKAILSSFHLIPDLSTRIAILKKIAGVAEIYGDVFFIRDTKQALLLSTTSAGRALYEARGNEGLGESLVDKFFEEMDSRTMAVLEEQIGDKKVADILRELVGITSIVPKSRAEIEKMMRDLITSLSSGLSSALSQKLFYTIDNLLTPAEKALSKDARQMVIRDKLVAAAKSYHYRAGKNVLDKTGYDKIIDAYVRKTLGSKINRPYDIREALKPFIADLNGQDWLAKVVSSIRDSATNLEATSATPNDKALASAYGDHIINQITSDDPALLNQAIDNIDPVLEKAIVDALVNMKSASLLNNQVLSYLMMNVPGITLYKAKLVANFMKSNFAVTLTVKEKADLRNKINAVVGKANKNLAEDIYRAFASGDVSEMDVLALLANHLGVTAITAAERVEYGVLLQDIMSARNAKELARAYKNLSMFTDRLESEHGVDSQKSLNDFLDRMIGHGYNSMLSGWQTWQRAAVSGVLEEMFNVIYDLFSGVTTFGNVYLSRIAMRGVREMLSGGGLSVAEKIVYAADALHKIVVKNDPIDYKFHRDWNINSNALEVKRQKLKDNWREVFKYVFGLMKGNFTNPADLINAMKTTRIPALGKDASKNKIGQGVVTVFDMFMYPFLKPLVVGTRMITWVDAVYTSVFADYENAIHELQRDLGTNGGNAPLTNLIAARGLRNAQLKAEIAAEVKAEGLKGTAAIRRKQELWLGMMETEAFKRTMHNLEVASMATYTTGLPGQASLFIDRLSSGDTVGSKTMKLLSMLLTPFSKVLGGSISRMYKATPIIGLSLEYTFQALHGKWGDVRNKIPSQVLDYNPDTGKHEWRPNTRLEAVRMHTRGIAALATLLGLLAYLFDFEDDDENSVTRIVPNKDALFRITGPGTTSFSNDKNVDKDYDKNAIQVKYNGRWITVIDYSIVPTLGPVCAFLGMLYDRHAIVSDPFAKGYIVQRNVYNNGSKIDAQYDLDFADMSKKLMYAMGHIMFESSVAQSARHVTDMFELITEENGKKTELTNETELARVQGKAARVWGNAISQYTKPSLYKQALSLYRDETQTPLPDYPSGSVLKRIIEKNMRDVLGLNILANSIYGEGRVLKDAFGVPIIPEQDFFIVGNKKEDFEVPENWEQRTYGEYLLRRKALDPLYEFIYSRTDLNELGRYYPKADIEGGIETIPGDLVDEISDVSAIRMGYKLMEPEELEKIKEMTSAEVEDYFNKKLKKKVGDEAKSIVFLRYLNAIDPTVMEYEEGYPMKFEGVKAILENLGFDLTDEEMEAKSPTGIRFFPDGGATTSKKNQDYLREKHPALYKWFFIDRKKMRDAIPFASDLDLLDWATFTDDDKARRKMLYEKYSQINSR